MKIVHLLEQISVVPVDDGLLLYKQLPAHVTLVEDNQLVEVIVHLDKAEDDAANNTEADEDNHNTQFLLG